MHDAVKTGDATVAQSINILDHANFVPAMLGLCCTFLATGLSSLRTGALPRWICLVSVILGVASPLLSGPPPSRHSRSSPYGLSSSRPSSPVACAPLTAKTQPTTDVAKILLRMPGAISRSNVRRVPSRLPRSRSDDKFETGHPDPGGYHRRGSIGPRCPRTVLGRGLVGQTERRPVSYT